MKKQKSKNPSTKVKIAPLSDRILIKPFTEQDLRAETNKKSLNFILPESMTKEKSAQGKVLAVGPGKYVDSKLVPVALKVGDVVIFSKYGYDEVELDGEELYLLKEDQILAVIKS